MNPKISLIITAHKGEKAFDRCLKSAISQTFDDYEIIVILDNVSNIMYKIACKYKAKFKGNFILKLSLNYDVSLSRNEGMELASGDYIMFVDGDDFITKSCLETLYKPIIEEEEELDLVIGNYINYYDDNGRGKTQIATRFIKAGLYDREKMVRGVLKDLAFRGFIWNKLFKRSVITENGLKFIPLHEVIEDRPFFLMFVLFSGNVFVIRKRTYYYVQHNDSYVKSSKKLEFMQKYINADFLCRALLEQFGLYDKEEFEESLFYRISSLHMDAARLEKTYGITDNRITECVDKQLALLRYKKFYVKGTPWEKTFSYVQFSLKFQIYKEKDLLPLYKIV